MARYSFSLPLRMSGICLLVALATQASAETSFASAQLDDFEQVRALFEPRGWRVEQDDAGYLSLYPPSTKSDPVEAKEEGIAPAPQEQVIAGDDNDELTEALARHGWTVSKEDDGSLLLYPPAPKEEPAADEGPTFPEPLAGEMIDTLNSGDIELPIDSWNEAHRMAKGWLSQHRLEGVKVGRIRVINRVYLVSIVESEHPYNLVAQLVIRMEDGAILQVA